MKPAQLQGCDGDAVAPEPSRITNPLSLFEVTAGHPLSAIKPSPWKSGEVVWI
jgi:hypothetical protein